MYKKRSYKGKSFQKKSDSPKQKGGFSRGHFGGGRRGGRGNGGKGRGFPIKKIDVSRYINKDVVFEPVDEFVPKHKFSDFVIDPNLKENISKKGYVLPTPIQDKAIPEILYGKDVVGIANTGTGKTAAFLIPIIDKILKNRYARVLVMVPTRELATQIADELYGFTNGLAIYGQTCVGGASMGSQIAGLRRNPNFVIGTPGRLKDLIARKALNLNQFHTVVLDEADRMLDMGFINDMRKILSHLSKNRHTLFFSATLSSEVEKLIGEFLHEPKRISVRTGDTAKSIEQDVVRILPGQNKFEVLCKLLGQKDFDKVLIFGRTKHGVEKISKSLIARGIRAESIHGNKTQNKRQWALDLFKRDHVDVLVATDVAARGLDISGVSHVINYDIPASHEDYIHRIGRTGRAGKKGKALTFID